METSDSECFESADEDFHSDNEDINIKKVPSFQKNTAVKLPELKKLSITDTEITNVKSKPVQLTEHNNDNSLVDNARAGNKHDRPTVKENVNKPEKKEKQPKAKLGVKLGTKIKKSDLNLPVCDTIKTSNKDIGDLCSYKDEQVDNVEKESRQVSKNNSEKHKRRDSTSDDGWDNDDFEFGHKDNNSNAKQGENNGQAGTLPREEENMWEDDNWAPISDVNSRIDTKLENKNVSEKKGALDLKDDDFNSRWMGWGNWGVSTLLNTATVGVTTITSHVSQGLTTVLESGIGVPQPEELARIHTEENKKTTELNKNEVTPNKNEATSNVGFGLGNFVSGVSQITKLVETTGTKVISGGLDTLETIGKKTMEVLQEGDPGLKKKRAFLKIEPDKTVLSHILREAKEKAEEENKLLEEKRFAKKANYESLFDDHQGLVHLEALEMLSKQCDIKLQTLLESHFGSELVEMQETMSQVNELCELTEEEEDEETVDVAEMKEKLDAAISEMNVPISYDKLISTWTDAEQWLENINLNICDELELHEQAIDTLAQLTAIAVEQFHKIGELLLIKEHRSTADEADSLVQLTTLLTTLLSHVSTKLSSKLHEKTSTCSNKERLNGLITNIYYEAANSSSYIKNAFQLLIPVLQVGAV